MHPPLSYCTLIDLLIVQRHSMLLLHRVLLVAYGDGGLQRRFARLKWEGFVRCPYCTENSLGIFKCRKSQFSSRRFGPFGVTLAHLPQTWGLNRSVHIYFYGHQQTSTNSILNVRIKKIIINFWFNLTYLLDIPRIFNPEWVTSKDGHQHIFP